MRTLILLLILTQSWWTYARSSPALQKKKQLSLRELTPELLTEPAGKSVTLQCPVPSTVLRMYKYIRRIKKGKELEYARRKLAGLLGIKYKWYKDGKSIKHHRSAWFLKLQNVQEYDAGMYTCKVFTARGGTRKHLTLKVLKQTNSARPILDSSPKNISLKEDQSVILECICKNTRDRPDILWVKWLTDKPLNLHEISNDVKTRDLTSLKKSYKVIDPKRYESFSKGSRRKAARKQKLFGFRLRLKSVTPKDTGVYSCILKNKFGSDHSNFYVNVQSLVGVAPYVTNSRKMQMRYLAWPAASTIKLKCYVTGDQPLEYQWFKNGKKLTYRRLDPKINTSTWILRLRELVLSDSGNYTCVVSNPFGVYKHSVNLKVVEKIRSAPVLHSSFPKNVSASKGENVSFECIELFSGYLSDYRWHKWHAVPPRYPQLNFQNRSQYTLIDPIHYSSIRIKSGHKYLHGVRLTLTNISENDVGLYTCLVSNQIGADYSSAFLKLNVKQAPQFLPSVSRPVVINIPMTEPLTMNCNASGDPTPQISWFKNGKLLERHGFKGDIVITGYTLRIKKMIPQHSGNYSCIVSNSRGSIRHTFNVNIKERLFTRPIILPSTKRTIKLGHKFDLNCSIISAEPLKVFWLKSTSQHGEEAVFTAKEPVRLDKYIYIYSTVIPHATSEHSGIYWCVAKNYFGTSRRKLEIEVKA